MIIINVEAFELATSDIFSYLNKDNYNYTTQKCFNSHCKDCSSSFNEGSWNIT